jgi:hypothetical protein
MQTDGAEVEFKSSHRLPTDPRLLDIGTSTVAFSVDPGLWYGFQAPYAGMSKNRG